MSTIAKEGKKYLAAVFKKKILFDVMGLRNIGPYTVLDRKVVICNEEANLKEEYSISRHLESGSKYGSRVYYKIFLFSLENGCLENNLFHQFYSLSLIISVTSIAYSHVIICERKIWYDDNDTQYVQDEVKIYAISEAQKKEFNSKKG